MKMPPKEKILEAYSCIADGRIQMRETSAEVHSSDGTKTYTVRWDGDTFASTDNATYWQGYPGYPVITVLLLQGRLPYDPEQITSLKGIPWKELNDRHKRNYAEAAEEALRDIANREEILRMQEKTWEALENLPLVIRRKLPG